MKPVIEAAKKYLKSDYRDKENFPDDAYERLKASVRDLEEMEEKDE
jgi:hypothetical protein